jgi:shikimate dehydrogenase
MTIDGETKLAFLLGYPVTHSASPAIHRAAFSAIGLNAAYLPWPVSPEHLPLAVQGLRSMENLLGANVTVPHKEAILAHLDGLTPEAQAIGAVNTIVPRGGTLVGDNTDGTGFLTALREGLGGETQGLGAVVLGAGGAARAVAVALARAGARRLLLLNRTLERANQLAECVGRHSSTCEVSAQTLHPHWRVPEVAGIRLLINTTSVGLHSNDPPLFDYASLSAETLVCDLIYSPPETPLLQAARATGCPAANGLGMLVHQGALAFERWTGKAAPIRAMWEAVGGYLRGVFP